MSLRKSNNVAVNTAPAVTAPAPAVNNGVDNAAVLSMIAALQAQNKELQAQIAAKPKKQQQTITLRVSLKGALSVYGLGRFPVTLYKQQWEALLSVSEDIKKFIAANAAGLTVKG